MSVMFTMRFSTQYTLDEPVETSSYEAEMSSFGAHRDPKWKHY